MADEEVSETDMPLACVPMVRSALVPEGRAAVLLQRENGELLLAVHPQQVTQQAVDEYNEALEHVGRHGIGSTEMPGRQHPEV